MIVVLELSQQVASGMTPYPRENFCCFLGCLELGNPNPDAVDYQVIFCLEKGVAGLISRRRPAPTVTLDLCGGSALNSQLIFRRGSVCAEFLFSGARAALTEGGQCLLGFRTATKALKMTLNATASGASAAVRRIRSSCGAQR